MQYYIRQSKYAEVHGPYSAQELATAIGAGRLASDGLATSDLGEPVVQLQKWRACDWFPLSEITELQSFFPAPRAALLLPLQPRPATLFTIVGQVAAIASSVYLATATTTSLHWIFWLLAGSSLWSLAWAIVSFSKQSRLKSHVG